MKKTKLSSRKKTSKNSLSSKDILGFSLLVIGFFVIMGSLVGYNYKRQIYIWYRNHNSSSQITGSSFKTSIHDIRNRKILSKHIDMTFGIDISHYQDNIKWKDVTWIYEEYPIHFVIVRSTMGIDTKDLTYTKNWNELHRSRFIRGAYHYYRPDESSTEQAQNFINTVKLLPGDLPPILDIEKLPRNQSINQLKVGIRNWLDIVERHYGVKPIIYSGQSYFDDYLYPEFNDCVIWIANYNTWVTDIQSQWTVWQFSEKGKVNGIKGLVDLNIFNGDLEELNELRIKN
jgi:lysozyme